MEIKKEENKQGNLDFNDTKLILEELEVKIQDLFKSKDYLNFLQKMSLLHDYSFNNILLILMQNPEASMIASYTTFNQMHRRVKKGSKALKIICPCPVKKTKKVESKDSNGNTTMEEIEENRTYFRVGNVFDVSQTYPIDEQGEIKSFTTELSLDSEFLQNLILNIKKSQPIPINYDKSLKENSANGYYKIDSKEIYLKEGMSNLQELKTLVHELAHHYQHEKYKELIKDFNRNDLEVSAESTAYVVFNMLKDFYGVDAIDSSAYSVGYVASWSKDKELKELKTTLTLISKISNDLFKVISTAIPKVN